MLIFCTYVDLSRYDEGTFRIGSERMWMKGSMESQWAVWNNVAESTHHHQCLEFDSQSRTTIQFNSIY